MLTLPRSVLFLALAAAAYVVLAAGSALTLAPNNDEAFFASPALNLAAKGYMGTDVLEPSSRRLPGIRQRTYWAMPLYMVNAAAWFKTFGFGLFTQRALSIAWGLVAIAAWFVILRRLSGSDSLAVLAAALAGLDYMFIYVGGLGRPDMMTAALGFAAIAAYLLLNETRLGLAVLLSQALMAAAFMTNPNALLHLAALGVVVLALDRRRLRPHHAAIAAIPYAVAAAAWGAYILQDPPSFWAQIRANSNERFEVLVAPWRTFLAEFTERYVRAAGLGPHSAGHSGPIRLKSLILAGYLFGIAAMLRYAPLRKHPRLRILLLMAAVYFVVQSFFNHKETIYLVHTFPCYAACLAVATWWIWTKRLMPRWLLAGGLALFLALQTGGHVLRARQNPHGRVHRPALQFINDCAPEGAIIYGTAAMAYDLGFDGRLVDDAFLGTRTGRVADMVVVEELYRDLWAAIRKRNPREYQAIETALNANYTQLRRQEPYEIYIRNGVSCKAGR